MALGPLLYRQGHCSADGDSSKAQAVTMSMSADKLKLHRARQIEVRDVLMLEAVSRCLSFRKAAQGLGLEPSAVSRRIRTIEDTLGVSLLERSSAGVRFTGAGERFLVDARRAVSQLDDAIRTLSVAGQGASGSVCIGFVGWLASRFLDSLLRYFKAQNPDVSLRLLEADVDENIKKVVNHSLDIAFVIGDEAECLCEIETLWREPIAAALPATDSRVHLNRPSLGILQEDDFIVSNSSLGSEARNYISRKLSRPSFSPKVTRFDVGREGLLLLVGLGFGAGIVCASQTRVQYPDVRFVPLSDEGVAFSGVWSRGNDNPAFRRFLTLARQIGEEMRIASAS
jgi:DNA-binding transcriptional LysR family regulator